MIPSIDTFPPVSRRGERLAARKPGALVTTLTLVCGLGVLAYALGKKPSAARRPARGPAPEPILTTASFKGLMPALGVTYASGAAFYLRQNRPDQLGGPITLENALWLTYATAGWFVMPAAIAFHRDVPPVLRRIYAAFFGSFVARGLIELYLLVGPKAWIPPYGIGHDAFMVLVLAAYQLRYHQELAGLEDDVGRSLRGYLNVLIAALLAEMLFAWMFYEAVERRTDFLWFADYSERFRALNPLMRLTVLAAHAHLVLMLARLHRPRLTA